MAIYLVLWSSIIGLAPLVVSLMWRQAVVVIEGPPRPSGGPRPDPAGPTAFHPTFGAVNFRGEGGRTWVRHPRESIKGSH